MKKTIEILNEYWSGKTVQLNTQTRIFDGKVEDCLYSDEQIRDLKSPFNATFVQITVTVDHVVEDRDFLGEILYILKFKEAPNLYHYLD